MRKLDLILYFILITAIISFNSCKKIFDPTYEFIFYTSFEQESELDGWKATNDSTELKSAWNEIISARSIIEKNVTKPLIEPPKLKKEEYDY